MLEEKGFQKEYAIRCLDANKHNHATTCYYLLLKRLEREGKIETSKYYQSAHTLYPKSLMASKESNALKEDLNPKHNSKKGSDGVQHRKLADSIEMRSPKKEEVLSESGVEELTNTDLESNQIVNNNGVTECAASPIKVEDEGEEIINLRSAGRVDSFYKQNDSKRQSNSRGKPPTTSAYAV